MTEESLTSSMARFEPLSTLWRFLARPPFLATLLSVLAVALALTTLFPQISPQGLADPQAWLAIQPGIFGQWGNALYALGLFDIYHAWWFRLLLSTISLTLFVWLVESAEQAWYITRRRPWAATALVLWGTHASKIEMSSPLSSGDVSTQLHAHLTREKYRWIDGQQSATPGIIATRRKFSLWAPPLGFAALLVALTGLVIATNWGWQNGLWYAAPGESQIVGHDTPYRVRLDAFHLQQDGGGGLCASSSKISWLDGETMVDQDDIGIGRPGALNGVTVRQTGLEPIVRIRGQDDIGRPLTLQAEEEGQITTTEVELILSSPTARRLVFVAGHDLFLVLTFDPPETEEKPTLHLSLLRGDSAALEGADIEGEPLAVLRESGTVSVDNLQLQVDLEYRPILQVDSHPGMGLVLAGMAAALMALLIFWLIPPWLAWFTITQAKSDTTTLQVLTPAGMGGSRWLSGLVDGLQEAIGDDA